MALFDDISQFSTDVTDLTEAFVSKNLPDNYFAIPKKRILTSRAKIKLTVPNFGLGGVGGDEIEIGEVDQFNASINFEVVKQFRPYGHTKLKTITRPAGWNINMSGGKIDWKLSYLVYMNERFLLGNNSNKSSVSSITSFGKGESEAIGNQLLFVAEQTITYYDGTVERYKYKDLVLLNYGLEMAYNNVEIPESLSAFSPERIIDSDFENDYRVTKIKSTGMDIISTMMEINKS
jgi:hypothetical protein